MKYIILYTILLFIMTNTTDWEYILVVSDRNYYDKYSFKDNWASSWVDSDVW